MTKQVSANLPASVHQRLLNRAQQTNRPFNELLQYYVMERFLYRLSKSSHAGKFILKGALMFTAWKLAAYRPTMDIDLLGRTDNSLEALAVITKDICVQRVEPDGVVFHPETVQTTRIAENANYQGVRVRLQASLGNARVTQQLDIGFGDIVVPAATTIEYPTPLEFPAPQLRGYSKESIVAEKFESLATLGMLNSRMKDYFDIWTLSRQFAFDGETLSSAITKTFSNRGTALVPEAVGLTSRFAEDPTKKAQWRGFLRKGRLEDLADLGEVVLAIRRFLDPMTLALVAGRKFTGKWATSGHWF